MSAFTPSLETLVATIDSELIGFLAARRASLPEGEEMVAEISRLIEAGGKRLRPLFCYWGFRAAGGADRAEIVAAASSLELLHTFAIVHDDIMDRSTERRGLPTTFALHGTDVALLVGDLALVLADAALMGSGFPPEVLAGAFESYSRMRQQVIAGQYLDVVAARRAEMTVQEARRIAVLKSGRYSIEEPLVIGAALAGAGPDLIERLHAFGAPLGEAFQLRDDLLGTFGDPDKTGKPVDSDIREGKRHVLYAFALERLEGDARDAFASRWGAGDLSDEEVTGLAETLEECGARGETEALLDELKSRAMEALEGLQLDTISRAALTELAGRATDRAL